VRFSTPNPERCDLLKLNAGAAEFSAYGLGNSRCRRVEFEGGVGAVTLDLTGAWSEDATLTLRLALGELTLRLPENLGVELSCDRFLSRFEPHGFTRTGNVYRSAGFDKAPRRIKVDITSAVGGVNVVWVPAGNP
jgi:predicted membrane protein